MREQLQNLLNELYQTKKETHPTSMTYILLLDIIYKVEKILKDNED